LIQFVAAFILAQSAHYSGKSCLPEDEEVKGKREHRDLGLVGLEQLLLLDSKQEEVFLRKDLSNKSPVCNGLK
jgi:hypothetical protein